MLAPHSQQQQKQSHLVAEREGPGRESVAQAAANEDVAPPVGRKGRARNASTAQAAADTTLAITPTRKRGAALNSSQSSTASPARGGKRKRASGPDTPTRSRGQDVYATDAEAPSLRQSSKPKVLFTGVVDEQGQKIVQELGGELESSVYDCTHLITDKVRRTLKFLCCVARGVQIVSPDWLERCRDAHTFIDSSPFMLKDEASEKQHKFSLEKSLEKAAARKLLSDYQVHATRSVLPPPPQMKDIVESAGGKYLSSLPKKFSEDMIVISTPADKAQCHTVLDLGIPVVNPEFILTGILRQEADIKTYQLFGEQGKGKRRASTPIGSKPKKSRR